MAGYLGTKAVLLSTTAADVIGNAEIGGSLTVGGNLTSTGIDDNATSTAITIDSSQNVGIGTSSTDAKITVDTDAHLKATSGYSTLYFNGVTTGSARYANIKKNFDSPFDLSVSASNSSNGAPLIFNSSSVLEAMRIDASGNVLVGTTSSNVANQTGTTQGVRIAGAQNIQVASTGISAYFNKLDTDGDIVEFRKSSSTVGRIGNNSSRIFIGSGETNLTFNSTASRYIFPSTSSGGGNDNTIDLGISTSRFDDIYATNGTIQTSDRNEKQDIEVLNAAEQRVAVACKGLLRKFRWKDAVAEKGDDARIHFGIIAQDLQDAFAAEGLDAGRYAMFISSTWWETQTEVPAVEAVAEVLDEEGNVVTEAVEAKEAYTRTDTYETLEEAPEGATERTRLGVRYPELLAFIIGAM